MVKSEMGKDARGGDKTRNEGGVIENLGRPGTSPTEISS